jgi:hypothetical protein
MDTRVNTVVAWANSADRVISPRFHNLLLHPQTTDLMIRLRVLDSLFAVPPPPGRGVYRHHDGYRS